jgi:hypothetical protein
MDHVETIVGLSIQIPLLQHLRGKFEFAAWNALDIVDKAITLILAKSPSPILSVDFSGFDASVPELLIRKAFDILRQWFEVRWDSRIDWLERQFLNVGILTPDGVYTGRFGGVPSGSALTNLIDSIVQLILWNYVSVIVGSPLVFITVLGDDGVVSFAHELDMDNVERIVLDHLGMTLSESKGSVSRDEVQFLQRLHLKDYRVRGLNRGVRSIVRTWNGSCHLERKRDKLPPEFFTARAIMQVENCKWHPRFSSLVKLLYHSDKFLKTLDPSEIIKKSGGIEKIEEVLNLRSFKYGVELPSRGFDQFETVKLLRKLRRGQD